jgi:MtN3 and saliva related transmembrane protein
VDRITLLGYAAAACTTLAFVPQVVRAWRSRSTRDISLGMFVVLTTGMLLWLVYGLLTANMPIVYANAATFVLSLTILVLKIRNG